MGVTHRLVAIAVLLTGAGGLLAAPPPHQAPSAVGASPLAAELPAARDIVARHVSAIGGAQAFKALRSVHVSGKFELTGVGVGGDFDVFAARPNRFLLRLAIPGLGAIEQAYDGKVGWTMNPASGPEVLEGRELRETADEAWFDRTLYEPERVKSMTTIERLEFDGRPAFKVKVILQSGTESFDYFDAESGWQIGTEAERATAQGIVSVTTFLRAPRRFGNLTQPGVLVQRAVGIEQVLTVSAYEYDTVTDSVFAMPPAIAALVGK